MAAKLTPRQKAFAEFYIQLGNAEQAAIKAGYSARYARGKSTGDCMTKDKGGRPLKFKTVKALQEAIDKYFADCEEMGEPLTVTGLAIALKTTRETLMDYQEKDGYSDAVKMAKLKIENAYEKRLIARGNGGDIFALKQFGWRDRMEQAVEVSGNMSLESKLKALEGDKF